MSRHIDFEAIENFRDFGGYDTAHGRPVRRGRLFRSGHHWFATDADLERLRDLGVGAIADLRGPSEREREPSRRWPGFAGAVIESDLVNSDRPDWVEVMKAAPMTAEWWYENTLEHYGLHASEPRHIEVFRGILRHLADGDGALVVHCAAGKDRTGAACALVHHICGVGHDDMVADFLLTNDEERLPRKMAQAADFVERMTGRRPDEATMRVAVQVFPAYLNHFLTTVRADYGSVDGYLETVLGVDERQRERIRERLLG